MKDYEKIPYGKNHYAISFISGKYYGIMYIYNSLKFIPDGDDGMIMKFEYDIIVGKEDIESIPDFEKCVGDILLEILEENLNTHELIFTGGKEE